MTQPWPELPFEQWTATRETLHMWLQIIGKIRLSKTKWANHSWHVALYVTPRGLTTSIIHDKELRRTYALEMDFVEHKLIIECTDGATQSLLLQPEPVAQFYERCFSALGDLGIRVQIDERPNEVLNPIPFSKDTIHSEYDPEFAHRYWRALLQADRLMKIFSADFMGKVSPVHFFWGSNDMAATRFSGRRAPAHPGGIPHLPDLVTREAYSHEVSSCGFWPGDARYPHAAFYSYAYPAPPGFEEAKVPQGAFFHAQLGEFILPYESVRKSEDPDRLVLDFFQRTFDAAATLGQWDRGAFEPTSYLKELQSLHKGQ